MNILYSDPILSPVMYQIVSGTLNGFIDLLRHPIVRGYLWTCFVAGMYTGYYGSVYAYNKLQRIPGVAGDIFRETHTPVRQWMFVVGCSLCVGGFYVCRPFATAISLLCSPFITILNPLSRQVQYWIYNVINMHSAAQEYDESSTSASSEEDVAQ